MVFVRFVDEELKGKNVVFQTYKAKHMIFNSSKASYNSAQNYFKQAFYGKFDWKNRLIPAPIDGKVISFKPKYKRGYYKE